MCVKINIGDIMTKRIRKKKKKKLKIGRVIIALIILAGIGFAGVKGLEFLKNNVKLKRNYKNKRISRPNKSLLGLKL